jgi:ferritin-like metal-binding protein YciE
MAETETLHDAFLEELRDAYDAEKQLIKALPKMAKAAESETLRSAFQTHLEETQGHAERLEQVFASLDEKVRGKHCDGIAGIIEEGKAIMEEDFEGTTLDACLIAAAQRAEHYEMAAYGTLVAWAKAMGHQEAVGLLEEILQEEKATDEKLTQIAESGINQEAAQLAHGGEQEGEEGEDEGRSGSRGSQGRRASASGSSSSRAAGSRSSSSRSSGSRSSGTSRSSSSSSSRKKTSGRNGSSRGRR